MARIIRTTPNLRSKVSLRVIFSFLLFMQIQMPNAHGVKQEKVTDLSFYSAAKKARQITLAEKKNETPVNCLALKAN